MEIFLERINKVFVEYGESVLMSQARKSLVTGPRCIGSKFNYILRVTSCKGGAVEYSCMLIANNTKLETDYLKVGKLMHNMLRQNSICHIFGMVTTGTQVRLLFMVYDAGYVNLLRTKSLDVPLLYKTENMQIIKRC